MEESDTDDMEETSNQDELESSDHIHTFVIHLFRSETGREIALRQRLDVTTNGAVVVTSGLISISFTNADVSHVILLANVLTLCIFMVVEARRYQVHASLRQRVRSIETTYIAPLFNQISSNPRNLDYAPHIDPSLVDSLLDHKSPINRYEAIIGRLRSIYIYLFTVTYFFWLHGILGDHTDQSWLDHINQQAAIREIPGLAVFFVFTAVMLVAVFLTLNANRLEHHDLL